MSWQGRQRDNMPTQKKKSTVIHTHASAQPNMHTYTCTQTHSCGYEGVSWQARGQNNFLRFVMWNPAGILMTGSRDPGTMGVSCLCLTHILFIILFCNGKRKFAQAKDFSPLIISALAWDGKLCKFTDCFFLLSDFLKCSSFCFNRVHLKRLIWIWYGGKSKNLCFLWEWIR